ncbi:MAG TPA: DUF3108 domain-containing protein [Anaeromyxobacter sp.]|nr:DUF3108 domain-containing protein [Anaeromyxobacter sp.]
MTLLRRLAASAAVALAAAPAARAEAFSPGEETVLDVTYLGLPTGEGRILVGDPAGEVWPVIFQAKTRGVVGFVDVREHFVTYWDTAARLTRGSDLRAFEVGDYHQDSARFDRANGEATYTVQRNGRTSKATIAIPPDVHDLTSAFMWLRLQPLAPGQRYELPVVASRKAFTLVAEVQERETVEAPAGTFRTVKLKVRTQLDGKFSTKRDTFLWLSDDARHVLVKVSADFAVGSIVARLRAYRPGGRIASR